MYASFLRISGALYLDLFEQPAKKWFFRILLIGIYYENQGHRKGAGLQSLSDQKKIQHRARIAGPLADRGKHDIDFNGEWRKNAEG